MTTFQGRLRLLTGIVKLAQCLTRENSDALLKRATHRSKRQIEELVAEIAPRRDVVAVMRKLPERQATTRPRLEITLAPDALASGSRRGTASGRSDLSDACPGAACGRPVPGP